MVDWELELVAIIGRVARHVSRDEAMRYVAGFTVENIQRKELQPGDAFKSDWFRQKCFDGACPVGPWMMPTNQVPNIEDLGMRLWVDDELMQDTNTGNMIFSVAEQVAELSHQLTLHPGDMIMTGTGAGVGLGRGRFLKTGNTVRCMIEGIGEFSHYIG
ncbi:2-keto-4-pentenoate hydratase 2-oxohepta-3-ene-dioic acid hydratase [Colletotrichum chrysophilum]|uniref:2-keto-4-pentenoate hydratase 2-oxohepta-3-ene-dioic acid hydratase n=1 Tax=Colletotrichum chrysophilum TaxID=1836956 RepID=A0AAD9EM44_9PEZI|nr:2-keto-4-pentenoate hydratase 2-oxohepta-3-ene-dioic acid hydratase [Colletotrichum chrysophilum]